MSGVEPAATLDEQPSRLYRELAPWFHLLTHPAEYEDEAEAIVEWLSTARGSRPATLLELGSGGGNNASHLKRDMRCTLTDLSPDMLALSRTINPECDHVQGDMRDLRLGRTFDAVLVHDAVCYLTTEDDVARAAETAAAHLAPGGAAVFCPDHVKEEFAPHTQHGGHDGEDGRGLRYVSWTWDPDPDDGLYTHALGYLVRDVDGSVRSLHDCHLMGLFSRDTWLAILRDAGFEARALEDAWGRTVFVGTR